MWARAAKPNWIGEYGLEGQQYYPELMHHANWAALAAGAAITPVEWNDAGGFGRFDSEMAADMARLAQFVEEVPLVPMTLREWTWQQVRLRFEGGVSSVNRVG